MTHRLAQWKQDIVRTLHLLFGSTERSFATFHSQQTDGLWDGSYHQHRALKRRMRLLSLSSLVFVCAVVGVTTAVMQLLFPFQHTPQLLAADTTYQVTTLSDSGTGSMRQAITSVNSNSGVSQIELTVSGTVTLASALPALTQPVSMSMSASGQTGLTFDGSQLAADTDCWEIAAGAENATIFGLSFAHCPGNGLVVSAASNITLGSSQGTGSIVHAYDSGKNGIDFRASSSTIQYLNLGAGPDSTSSADGNTEDGIVVSGDSNTLSNITAVQNGGHGIAFETGADGNTLQSSEIGVQDEQTTALPNVGSGVYLAGDNNSVGGYGDELQNVIVGNSRYGIEAVGATNTHILHNMIGVLSDGSTTLGNTLGGILLSGSQTGGAIGELNQSDSASVISGNGVAEVTLDGVSNVSLLHTLIGVNDEGVSLESGTADALVISNSSDIAIGAIDPTTSGITIANHGRGIVVTDSTSIEIVNSDFSGNTSQTVVVSGAESQGVQLSRNTYSASEEAPVTLTGEANNGIDAPRISSFTAQLISGNGGSENGRVEVYADGVFIGEDTSIDETGAWTLVSDDFSAYEDQSVRAISIDEENNTSEFSAAATFGSSGSGGDSSGETTTEDETFSYVKPTNTTVNEQPIYDALTAVYVPFNDVRISGNDADNSHEVRVQIKDSNATVVSSAWEQVNDNAWTHEAEVTLVKGDTYTVHGKARVAKTLTPVSKAKKLATIIASNPGPTLVSLKDRYTITAKPADLVFSGLYQGFSDSAVFVLQNHETGASVDQCTVSASSASSGNTTRSGSCALSDTLSLGHYNVLFHSVATEKGRSLLSAPATTQLLVTRPRAVSVFTTDTRSAAFRDRITVSAQNTVGGLGPAGSVARVSIDDQLVGQATFASSTSISWTYALDMTPFTRGRNYVLKVRFYDATTDKEIRNTAIVYPFRYANPVTVPVIPGLSSSVEQYDTLDVGVLGGSGHLLTVREGDAVLARVSIDKDPSGVLAHADVTLPTGRVGSHTITLQSEDATGLVSGEKTYTYTVSAPVVEEEGVIEEESDETDETPVDSSDEGGGIVIHDGGSDEPDSSDETDDSDTPATTDSEEEVIPEEWSAPAKDATEKKTIKTRLNKKLKTVVTTGQIEIYDADGTKITERPIEKNAAGDTVLRKKSSVGLAPVTLPWQQEEPREQEVVTFTGEADPYALVTIEIRSDPIVKVTRADANGKWTLTVPVDAIPEGEHTAYVQTESKGVQSEQVEIAKFVVIEEKRISNTTWIFIINIVIALLVLTAAIVLQIRHRHRVGNGRTSVSGLPASATNAVSSVLSTKTGPASTLSTIVPPTQTAPPDSKPPDIHSALGV